jgi:hypothetical protein
MSYSSKEKEPTLACSDQDMSYSIKEKEPTLVCSDQDISKWSDMSSLGIMFLIKNKLLKNTKIKII